MRAALVLVTILLLAGCVSQAPAVTKSDAKPASAPADPFHPASTTAATELTAPKPTGDIVIAQPGFAEPNIAAAYDAHTLYVANPGFVWRSDDNGKTWKVPKNAGIEGGGDGDVAVDANGTVYYLGLLGKQNRRIPFLASTDGGESWSNATDLSAGSGVDREWIDVTPDGKIYATWRGVANETPGAPVTGTGGSGTPQIEYNGSLDGGKTWLGKVRVGPDGDGGNIVHDPVTGTLAIGVVDQAETTGTTPPVVHVYTSSDQGATWTGHDTAKLGRSSPVEPNGYASDFPVLSFDGNGTLYLVYSADSATTPGGVTPPEEVALYGIYMQVSHDQGASWSKPQLLSDRAKDARFPWIAAGAPGRIAVVWYENVRGVPGELLPDEWNVKLYESLDGAGSQCPAQSDPASRTAAHSNDTRPCDGGAKGIVASLTSAPNHVGALCTSGTGCLAADRSMLDFFEVAIGRDGQPVVAYASSTLGTGLGAAVKRTEIHYVSAVGASLI